jgi:hypothetical protein
MRIPTKKREAERLRGSRELWRALQDKSLGFEELVVFV